MALSKKLLAGSPRIAAAANSAPAMRVGESGDGVVRLQLALVTLGHELPRSTADQSKIPDGSFGPETMAAVRAFQAAQRLTVDGVAGKQTFSRMDTLLPIARRKPGCCSNGQPSNTNQAASRLAGATFHAASPGVLGITLPTGVRFLTPSQETLARSVFGKSLDFTRIVLSDATGLGGRPFTAAVPLPPGIFIVVINAGTFSPSRALLIHELTHAWQSQHSLNPTQFMLNSAASQAVADELLGRFGVDASAYYYKPGKRFSFYAAEQIACQVESAVPAIVSNLSGPPHAPFPSNELSLSSPRWEVRGPGVVTSC